MEAVIWGLNNDQCHKGSFIHALTLSAQACLASSFLLGVFKGSCLLIRVEAQLNLPSQCNKQRHMVQVENKQNMDAALERRWSNFTPFFLVFYVGLSGNGTNDNMESSTPSFLPPKRHQTRWLNISSLCTTFCPVEATCLNSRNW